jgi:hypothetical protein
VQPNQKQYLAVFLAPPPCGFAHKINKSWKILFKIEKIRPSGFRDRTIQFRWDRRQSGASSGIDRELLLWASGVWMVERLEPWQPIRLEWWLIDLNEGK